MVDSTWKPAPEDRWNLRWAAHLYRRAAFGVAPRDMGDETPSWELLEAAVKEGREQAIAKLLAGADGQPDFRELMDPLGRKIAEAGDAQIVFANVCAIVNSHLHKQEQAGESPSILHLKAS